MAPNHDILVMGSDNDEIDQLRREGMSDHVSDESLDAEQAEFFRGADFDPPQAGMSAKTSATDLPRMSRRRPPSVSEDRTEINDVFNRLAHDALATPRR